MFNAGRPERRPKLKVCFDSKRNSRAVRDRLMFFTCIAHAQKRQPLFLTSGLA